MTVVVIPRVPSDPQNHGLSGLRCGRELKAGMVLTVEPGVYFIDAVLDPAMADPEKAKFFNIEKIKQIPWLWRCSS